MLRRWALPLVAACIFVVGASSEATRYNVRPSAAQLFRTPKLMRTPLVPCTHHAGIIYGHHFRPTIDYAHVGVQASLVLEDGTVFHGYSFGYSGSRSGEVVFNTGMVG
jgi:hypothetical protein